MSGQLKILTFLIILLVPMSFSRAALKDSDFDGVTDQAETDRYYTDPNNFDTDGDGFSDSIEILNGSNPLDSQSTPIVTPTDPVMWYVSRISGIVAFILLSISVIYGLVQTSRMAIKYRFLSIPIISEVHRAVSWFSLVAVVIHFSSLLFDQFFKLKIVEALVPFQLVREFTSTMGFSFMIPVSLGIFALYFIVFLIVTSEFRNKIVSAKAWRVIHYISFATYLLFIVHGFLSGTDSKEIWMMGIYGTSFGLVTILLLLRLFRKNLFFPKLVKNEPVKSQSQSIEQS